MFYDNILLKAVRKGIEEIAAVSVTDLGDDLKTLPVKENVLILSIAKDRGTEESIFCNSHSRR